MCELLPILLAHTHTQTHTHTPQNDLLSRSDMRGLHTCTYIRACIQTYILIYIYI